MRSCSTHPHRRSCSGFSASTAFSTAFVAANEGIFKKHGLDVEMKLVPNSSTTPAALVADSLQVATPTAPITLQAVEQGLDLMVLAGGSYYAKGIEDVAIMVRPDSPIKVAKDFEGKRVATAGLNAFLHVLFRKWMMENGVDYKKVTFTETPFAQQLDVLRSGQVDGILAVQPFLARALETNMGRVIAYYIADLEGETLAGWYVATRKWVEANPKQAAAFAAAIHGSNRPRDERSRGRPQGKPCLHSVPRRRAGEISRRALSRRRYARCGREVEQDRARAGDAEESSRSRQDSL